MQAWHRCRRKSAHPRQPGSAALVSTLTLNTAAPPSASSPSGRGLSAAGLDCTLSPLAVTGLHAGLAGGVLPGVWRLQVVPRQGPGESCQAGHEAFGQCHAPEYCINMSASCKQGGAHVHEPCSSSSTREDETSEIQSKMKQLSGQHHAVSWSVLCKAGRARSS